MIVDEGFRQHYHNTYIDLSSLLIPVSLRYSFFRRKSTIFFNAGGYFSRYLHTSTRRESEMVYQNIVQKSEGEALALSDNEHGFWGGVGVYRPIWKLTGGVTLRYFHSISNMHPTNDISVDINSVSLALIPFRKFD
ncbi:hypothetical protein [Cesiribacter sp. SM1]|uniref:hypothetical protein n=1 Tax=Cesiribacter sp. SM1 TaxID=2861196 RepID=UPI001CD4F835|nr:hypothetical protein [Cesiribacter sp. SM1]